jgi:hypothetical protein
MKKRTTWREKLEKDQPPVLKPTPKGMMLIPRPLHVDALMRKIGKGKLATVGQIRERLAKDCGADYACPLTTGIFMWIASGAAEEDLGRGMTIGQVTPYWRVIKDDGSLNPKLPGGVAAQAAHLTREGHTILPPVGKKPPRVKDFEQHLQEL